MNPDADVRRGRRRHALQRGIHRPDGAPGEPAAAGDLEGALPAAAEAGQDQSRAIPARAFDDGIDPARVLRLPAAAAVELRADDEKARGQRRTGLRMPSRRAMLEDLGQRLGPAALVGGSLARALEEAEHGMWPRALGKVDQRPALDLADHDASIPDAVHAMVRGWPLLAKTAPPPTYSSTRRTSTGPSPTSSAASPIPP